MPDWWRPENPFTPAWGSTCQAEPSLHPLSQPHGIIKSSTVILFFVVLGIVFRVIRYAQNLPLWSDECLLSVNFIDRGYGDLLGPLVNGQIAPILFLWLQRLVLDVWGFSEWTLRLFPLVCGIGSVLVFWRLARRIFGSDEVALMLAVGIFTVSVHPIRHAAEAKPYATDLLVALVLLVPAVEWLRQPLQVGWLWGLAVISPMALAFSNPAAFVAGGIGIGLLRPVWKSPHKLVRLAFATFALTLLISFLSLHCLLGPDQWARRMPGLRRYWASSFPPLRDPMRLAIWLISAHTGSAFAYPGGGARGGSAATFVACLIGVAAMLRRGDRSILTCLTVPMGLALIAASMHLYPYGSEARLMQFAAPSICVLSGLGTAAVLARVQGPRLRRNSLAALMLCLVVCGVVPQVVSSLRPYRTLYDHQVREFARRFWREQSANAEVACIELDYGVGRGSGWQGKRAWYLCNQMIYSPDRRRDPDPTNRGISADRPLRCVLFGEPEEGQAVQDWLARMKANLTSREQESMRFPSHSWTAARPSSTGASSILCRAGTSRPGSSPGKSTRNGKRRDSAFLGQDRSRESGA